jgi:hypothetical protein
MRPDHFSFAIWELIPSAALRVISWIVLFSALQDDPRSHTKGREALSSNVKMENGK